MAATRVASSFIEAPCAYVGRAKVVISEVATRNTKSSEADTRIAAFAHGQLLWGYGGPYLVTANTYLCKDPLDRLKNEMHCCLK